MRRVARGLPGLLTLLLAAPSCSTSPASVAQAAPSSPANALTPAERREGWMLLFDGATTTGWRGYRRPDMPAGWAVVDGTLSRVGEGGDIITEGQYRSFELALEWQVAPAGNSGVFYLVTEAAERSYETGAEMQVLDDAAHPDGRSRLTAAGANFGLYPSPASVVKPAGEWNSALLRVRYPHVEHWLNGVKVVEYELGSADWSARVAASKFSQWPGYGKAPRGHIGLQDHGDRVAYRAIKIRVLDP